MPYLLAVKSTNPEVIELVRFSRMSVSFTSYSLDELEVAGFLASRNCSHFASSLRRSDKDLRLCLARSRFAL